MKIHLRFDQQNSAHSRSTLFVNGANVGALCLTPADAVWLHHILQEGCDALSPTGKPEIQFVSSGTGPHPTPAEIEHAVSEGLLRLNPRVIDSPR